MSSNPRIGKTLRIPIELIPEDEDKINKMIEKMEKGGKSPQKLTQDLLGDEAEIVKKLEKTNVGEIVTMSKEHIGTLVSFAKNPAGMLLSVFMSKFSKGAGALALAFIIMEAIKFAIDYMMRDGMPLDRRFKRYIHKEVVSFLDRMFKAELRQGFRSVIVTTIGGLRGGRGQVSGNLFAIRYGGIESKIPFNQYADFIPTGATKGMRNSLPHGTMGRFK